MKALLRLYEGGLETFFGLNEGSFQAVLRLLFMKGVLRDY
jgi:hypothetical protein